jgi:pyrimidine operon attenuation protein/uracil phosphoribosyltransferase
MSPSRAVPLPDADQLVEGLAAALRQRLQLRGIESPCLVGVQTGGVWVAERLARKLGLPETIGVLDISFHRDDFGRNGLNPSVHPSHLPWDVAGRHVVLVDDVLYTGRTVRAALNEIFDWGRPASVTLAVLVARDGRELPIQADVQGTALALGHGQHLKLRGPTPLRLELVGAGA